MSRGLDLDLGHGQSCPRQTLAELYRAEASFAWRCLARFGIPERDRADLTQEVFIVAQRKLHTLDPEASARSWVHGICRRVAAGHRRRAFFTRETSDESIEAHVDERPGPHAEAERASAKRRLARILDTLSLDQREVFVMFEIDGLEAPVIAETIGCPVGTVHSRLYAARRRFELELERLRRAEARRLA